MVIGIDAREIENGVVTGIGRALAVFLSLFSDIARGHRCILFSTKSVEITAESGIHNVVHPEMNTFLWDQYVLPKMIREHGVDIFFSPYYKIPLLGTCRHVSTIMDLMYLFFTPYYRQMPLHKRLYYPTFGRLYAHRADMIVCSSEYSKREIEKFYRVQPEKIAVIYLGLSDAYRPVDDPALRASVCGRYGIHDEYILYTGNFKLHKNVETLLSAFSIVKHRVPGSMLVLAGAKDGHFRRIEPAIVRHPFSSSIIVTGRIPQQEQIALYSAARLFVMPSLYEGFGYPPLEAMACGTPVVSSVATSLKEIVGDAALVIDPLSPDDIASKIVTLWNNGPLADELRVKGYAQARKFSQRCYAETLGKVLYGDRG
jgi:hypothetical protein